MIPTASVPVVVAFPTSSAYGLDEVEIIPRNALDVAVTVFCAATKMVEVALAGFCIAQTVDVEALCEICTEHFVTPPTEIQGWENSVPGVAPRLDNALFT